VLGKAHSAGVLGIDAYSVLIEVDVSNGLPQYNVVGLPDSAVKEGAVRVRAALENAGFALPPRRINVNLAPADIRKDGAAYDLPIALAMLVAFEVLPAEVLEGFLWLGELGFDGGIRRVAGSLPVALLARRAGYRGLVLPESCATEAAVVHEQPIFCVGSLKQLVDCLQAGTPLPRVPPRSSGALSPSVLDVDLAEVRGNEQPKRALEIAAAGGHNLLFMGPPGSGKSMLARRLPTILPPLTESEAIEVTSIYSAAGLLKEPELLYSRPFRAPHHDISVVGLIGGGPYPRPGEISLAHHGVLFLDELPEFARAALEALRQPLEDRQIHIARARCAITYPASFSLVAAFNPCPCGFRGSALRSCTCDLGMVCRYLARLSGPLLDRFDLHVEVPHVDYRTLLNTDRIGEPSATIRERVVVAQEQQAVRAQRYGECYRSNAGLRPDHLPIVARLDAAAERLLLNYARQHALSSRAVHRVLRVARTIADLALSDGVSAGHLAEALSLRVLDRPVVS
jgi:magnesium chelatase family protein